MNQQEESIKIKELAKLVKNMRRAQIEWYHYKSSLNNLKKVIELENKVDNVLNEILSGHYIQLQQCFECESFREFDDNDNCTYGNCVNPKGKKIVVKRDDLCHL